MKPYRNVVVGTDGSATAGAAVRTAAELAMANGARLTVVTAFTPHQADVAKARAEAPEEIQWRITESGQADETAAEACRVARELGVKDVRARSESGDPADALIDVAEDTGGDVIVVGSKGMTGAARFFLGSVPNKVSHHAPCDVLIVATTH
jgi:nucleotide-binding universal stress UspA family protein